MMLRQLVEQMGVTVFAEIALVIFVVVFVGVLVRLWRTPRQEVDAMASLPLANDETSRSGE